LISAIRSRVSPARTSSPSRTIHSVIRPSMAAGTFCGRWSGYSVVTLPLAGTVCVQGRNSPPMKTSSRTRDQRAPCRANCMRATSPKARNSSGCTASRTVLPGLMLSMAAVQA
jgi:hypothetical protein